MTTAVDMTNLKTLAKDVKIRLSGLRGGTRMTWICWICGVSPDEPPVAQVRRCATVDRAPNDPLYRLHLTGPLRGRLYSWSPRDGARRAGLIMTAASCEIWEIDQD